MRTVLRGLLASLLVVVVACGGGEPATTVNFALPGTAGADFFDLPYPNELHRAPDGTIDLAGVPRPNDLVGQYLDEFVSSGHGFGTQAAIYFRLSAPLDPATLPDPAATMPTGAAVFLVDVDPASPGRGERTPLKLAFNASGNQFIGANWLALLPYPGFPLRERTLYAAVVTTAVRDVKGKPLAPAAALRDILGGGGDAAAGAAMKPLLDWLDAGGGAPARAQVAGATVFRTQDATSLLPRFRQVVHATAAPTAAGLTAAGTDTGVEIFEGTYEAPHFQYGTLPYSQPSQGGAFQFDANGDPTIASTETMRFAVTVPKGPPPAGGWPIVLYQHGTGGNYKSFIYEDVGNILGDVTDSGGATIAKMAVFGIDQVLHGPRAPAGTNVELTFFNFQNIAAGRDNVLQGAVDNFQLLRLAAGLQLQLSDGTTATFDGTKVAFMGHSQGGLTGPGFVAHEPAVRAAVLSGAGGNMLLSLLGKTEPVDIPALVAALLQLPEVDEFHPFLNLLQAYLEPADPANYARAFFREPPAGQSPKSIFQSLGIVDHYTPIPTIMALAVAMGVQPAGTLLQPIDGMDLAGIAAGTAPIVHNVADGAATGVVCEYQAPANDDGHFVVFDVPAARAAYARFLATAMRDGVATLMP